MSVIIFVQYKENKQIKFHHKNEICNKNLEIKKLKNKLIEKNEKISKQ